MARHPLEEILNASANDIMTAIQHGFRAQVDVKGKLAELFMAQRLCQLKMSGSISAYTWQDLDGKPDFFVTFQGRDLVVECKNVRNKAYKTPPSYKVELQKTRNSMDGKPTRGYGCKEFDVLGVALFNQTRTWDYLWVATKRLKRRLDNSNLLVVMQPVPMKSPYGRWTTDPIGAFEDAVSDDGES